MKKSVFSLTKEKREAILHNRLSGECRCGGSLFLQGERMKFFFCFFLLFALVALPGKESGSEVRLLKTKTELQQQEIERLTALLAEKERELKKLRIWMNNISADSRLTTVSDREQRLLHALKILADSSGNMALKTVELAELLRPKLNALPLASSERIRLVMALEDLERSAARVSSIADTAVAPEDTLLKNVRVAAVRSQLNMAVLSAGALQGVFPGMTFVTADGRIRLRVLETRSMISGAVPVSGDINSLTPGCAVKLEIIRRPPEVRRDEK